MDWNKTEFRSESIAMVNYFLTRVLRPFNGEGIVFSINGRTTGYRHEKE